MVIPYIFGLLCLTLAPAFGGENTSPAPVSSGALEAEDSIPAGLPGQGNLYFGYQGRATEEAEKSINSFLQRIFHEVYLPVYLVYDGEESFLAAKVMLNFLVFQRGFYRAQARSGDANIFLLPASQCNPSFIHNFHTILIGDPKTHRAMEQFNTQDPIRCGRFKGIYKLYTSPRTLIISGRLPKYYEEITRALTRSYQQYTGPSYVYDLAN